MWDFGYNRWYFIFQIQMNIRIILKGDKIMKKEKRQKMCLEIIDQFEQLLEEKDISIPCGDSAEEKERHDGGNNARIYGAEYWRLEDGIHKILEQEDSDNTK